MSKSLLLHLDNVLQKNENMIDCLIMFFLILLSSHNHPLLRLTEENYKIFENPSIIYIEKLVLLH